MNKALQLFDEQYILKTYRKKILARLPQYKSIQKIQVEQHKSLIWETTYHVVVEYVTTLKTKDDKKETISIFCSAHSSEPRKNVYESLKFLCKNGFNDADKKKLTAPYPLFYSKYFKGTFYVGVRGKNLYYYIKEKKFKDIEFIASRAGAWFAKLHGMPIEEAKNFNKDNSRIKTVKPGMDYIFEKIETAYPEYFEKYKQAYERVNQQEKKFLASTDKRWLVHGDAHPENIIKMSGGKIAVIDFTDLCLSDFARDLGSCLQQLNFKITRHIEDGAYAEKVKKIFLESYLKNAKIKLTEDLEKRINAYYDWTTLRTIAFFLTKHHPMVERAEQLLNTFI